MAPPKASLTPEGGSRAPAGPDATTLRDQAGLGAEGQARTTAAWAPPPAPTPIGESTYVLDDYAAAGYVE